MNLSLKSRLLLSIIIIIMIGASVMIYQLFQFGALHHLEEETQNRTKDATEIQRTMENIYVVYADVADAIINRNVKVSTKALNEELSNISADIKKVHSLVDTDAERALAAQYEEAMKNMQDVIKNVLLPEIQKEEKADYNILMKVDAEIDENRTTADETLEKIIISLRSKQEEAATHFDNIIQSTSNLVIILIILSIITGAVILFLIFRQLDKIMGASAEFCIDYAGKIRKGDFSSEVTLKDGDKTSLLSSMKQMADIVKGVIDEFSGTSEKVANGHLDVRANEAGLQGAYKELVGKFNLTLDAVINPLNVTAEYIDRISKGDIPPKIVDVYKGDFNEIKNNINQCIDVLNSLIDEMNNMSLQHDLGDIDVIIRADRFSGAYHIMAKGINDMVNGHISVKKKAMACVGEFGKGNFDAELEKFPGKKAFINDIIENVRSQIKEFIREMKHMSREHDLGDIDVLMNTEKFQGEFAGMAKGVNDMVNGHISVKKKAMACISEFGKGNFDAEIEKFPGKKVFINNTIENVRENLKAIENEVQYLIQSTKDGKLDIRGDRNKFTGGWAELVVGMNDLIDAFVGPINVTAEYVDRISKGDIPQKITDVYKGDFNEIKNNLNQCIDAINLLVSDSMKLAMAADEGRLDTRADEAHHYGDFRNIVMGMNNSLESLVTPMNEAGDVLGEMASGDLTARMMNQYKGDYNILKDSINRLGDSLSNVLLQVSESAQTVSSASIETASTAEEMASAAMEQSAQADEVASSVEEMSRTVTENAMAAGQTADMAGKNKLIAEEGGQVVVQTINKMKDIAEVVKTSASNIEKLGVSSQKIGEIILVIDDIADQTNLLALNAAIEAARAGEQGRGFAVVADEVRKLAERTTEATKQIASMIKGIQSETEGAVDVMKRGTSEVQSGIDLADKAGSALKQVVLSSQDVLDMINQIASASEEQSSTSEEISQNVMTISRVTNESSRRIQDIANAAESMTKLNKDLIDIIGSFKIARSGSAGMGDSLMTEQRKARRLTN